MAVTPQIHCAATVVTLVTPVTLATKHNPLHTYSSTHPQTPLSIYISIKRKRELQRYNGSPAMDLMRYAYRYTSVTALQASLVLLPGRVGLS